MIPFLVEDGIVNGLFFRLIRDLFSMIAVVVIELGG